MLEQDPDQVTFDRMTPDDFFSLFLLIFLQLHQQDSKEEECKKCQETDGEIKLPEFFPDEMPGYKKK
jgi:hypothetical protein